MPRYETSVVAESPRFKKVLRGSKSGMRLWQSRGGCDEMKRPTQWLCRRDAAVPRKCPRQVARQLRQDGADDKSSIHSNWLHMFVVVVAEYWSTPFHQVACMCSMSKQPDTGRGHLCVTTTSLNRQPIRNSLISANVNNWAKYITKASTHSTSIYGRRCQTTQCPQHKLQIFVIYVVVVQLLISSIASWAQNDNNVETSTVQASTLNTSNVYVCMYVCM